MKNILVMRHAKSDWNTGKRDFERPLNKRGLKSAPKMADYLLKNKKVPDIIIASSAQRAKTTAELVKKGLSFKEEIKFNPDFYYGDSSGMIDELYALPKNINTVLLVGHNPTVEELINKLTSEYAGMPTATIVSIKADIEEWTKLQLYENTIEWVASPKKI